MKHVPDHFTHADEPSGHCLLLIAAPTDAEIYGCFRAVSRKWRHSLLAERLWIEHDVPISSDFTSEHPPEAVQRIIAADRELILRIEVEIAGFEVGHGIWLGEGAEVDPAARVEGPVVIGDNSRLEARSCRSCGTACRSAPLYSRRKSMIGPS